MLACPFINCHVCFVIGAIFSGFLALEWFGECAIFVLIVFKFTFGCERIKEFALITIKIFWAENGMSSKAYRLYGRIIVLGAHVADRRLIVYFE